MADDIKYELQKIKDSMDNIERGKLYDIKEKMKEVLSSFNDIKRQLEDIKNKIQN